MVKKLIDIDENVWKQIKIKAIKDGVSINIIVEKLLQQV